MPRYISPLRSAAYARRITRTAGRHQILKFIFNIKCADGPRMDLLIHGDVIGGEPQYGDLLPGQKTGMMSSQTNPINPRPDDLLCGNNIIYTDVLI